MMNRMARKLVLVLAMAAAWLTSPAQAQVPCRYEVTHIIQGPSCGDGILPTTVGMGISPNGQYVCGYYQCIINTAAFVYDTQTRQFITIPVPVSAFTKAFDVNDAGVVVGTAGIASGNYGFIYNLHTGQVTHTSARKSISSRFEPLPSQASQRPPSTLKLNRPGL